MWTVSDTQPEGNCHPLWPTRGAVLKVLSSGRIQSSLPGIDSRWVRMHAIAIELDFARKHFTRVVFLKAEPGA